MLQDLPFQRLQLGAGAQSEVVGESLLYPAAGSQCVCLPAGAVQGRDEQFPQPFAQRMNRVQPLQVADQFPAGTEVDPGREVDFAQPQPGLLPPGPKRCEPPAVARIDSDPEALLGRTDRALYVAKRTGRDRVVEAE